MAHRNFSLQKENDCKFQLHFVKCCTLVFLRDTIYYFLCWTDQSDAILLCSGCISLERAGNTISRKGSVASVNRTGWSQTLRRGFRGQNPLTKFLGSKEYLDRFNDIGKTLSHSIQYKNYWNTSLTARDLFPMFTQSFYFYIIYCHIIKEYRCLKKAIHQLERHEWLLPSAFQQGLWQKLILVLTQENAFS